MTAEAIDTSEELEFELALSGTYWRNPPGFAIYIDDQLVHEDVIQTTSSHIGLPTEETMTDVDRLSSYHVVSFKHKISAGDHLLRVRFKHKDLMSDTLLQDGNIVQDLLLTVEKIKVDGVDLAVLVFDESECVFDQEHLHKGVPTKSLTQNVTLGYPGEYRLKFSSPFYLWLLERI